MANCGRLFVTLIGVMLVGFPALAGPPRRPNVIMILADDHGYGDVSTYGPRDVLTPHIDSLATDGMLFVNMRSNCTVCSPSRAALLTGRFPDQVGVPGVIRTRPEDSWGHFRTDVATLADHLKGAGYGTAMIGKWHLGLQSPNTPNERGFEFFHGFLGDMMDSYVTHRRHGINYMRRNAEIIEPVGHATDLFTDWAIEYLETHRATRPDDPCFVYLAYNAPHFPIEPPPHWFDRVRSRAPEMSNERCANVALVEHLDDSIGRLLRAIDRIGIRDETMVVFSSDNGGSLPHAQSNHPWRDGKQSHYDGGLRVPFVLRWPARVAAGSRSDYAGQLFDIFPTCLEAAGIPIPEATDALSLVPILEGGTIDRPRDLYFVRREGGAAYGGKSYEALIRGRWKLLQNSPYRPMELYDLVDDPYERVDLSSIRPEVMKELSAVLRERIRAAGGIPWQPPPQTSR